MKILVRGTNWIGDAVMSVPALRELRRVFHDDQITLHTRSWAEGLFRDASFIDEIVPFDPQKWKLKDALDNSDFLRDDGYDLAIILPNSFESALTTFLTRIPRRIGYNKDLRGMLLTDPVPVPEWKGRRHEVYYYLNLIAEVEHRVLGTRTVSEGLADGYLEVAAERREAAREMLGRAGVRNGQKVVALGPGSRNSLAKRWPAEEFGRLADRLAVNLDVSVVLVGGPDEKEVASAVAAAATRRPIDLIGQTTLDEVTAVLSVADLMVSNDMGLAHVAPAVGTPTIAVFGPTDPETTRPFGENAVVVRSEEPGDGHLWPSVDQVFQAAVSRIMQDEDDSEPYDAG